MDRLCDQASGQSTAVACFYFDFAARKEQSATGILGSLLKQVVGGMEEIPEDVSQAFKQQKKVIGGRGPQLEDIVKMLQTITPSLGMFVCIDAWDECAAAHRVKLLNSLQQILETSQHTRIFIIGRPHVRAEIEKRLPGQVRSLSVGSRKGDIVEYLRLRLEEDETPDAMDGSLEAEILEKIPEKISEMYVWAIRLKSCPTQSANKYESRFLLVSLSIDAILYESTISRRREMLGRMTTGLELGGAYGATIERIKVQDGDKSRLGMAALMWISHAERPLRADELCHALAVKLGSRHFDVGNIPSVSTLVSCCQGLITVDKEASTVRLIHFTLQEYLSARPDIFSGPHSAMAEICLTYLNSRQVKALSTAHYADTRSAPFLEYCSIYWGVHAKKELSGSGRSIALELLKENYSHVSTRLLLAQVQHFPLWRFGTVSPFSGLHCASFFGIVGVVAGLVDMECYSINEADVWGCGPLSWASWNGHQGAVEELLGREGVNPDMSDKWDRTPLLLAAQNGHKGVVKILLGREEVNPNRADNEGQTPLLNTVQNGHDGVAKILLGRHEVNPVQSNKRGEAPLLLAAQNGHEGAVKMLLGREDVNLKGIDKWGRTPLLLVAKCGRESVVKILLGQEEINPDRPDNEGQTPLLGAARNGHEGVVRILLGREEVNPDRPDNEGQTPLWNAARNGHEGVVKILLGQEEVSPDKPDKRGRTPLSYAARNGYEGVVKLLLGREEVSPDKPDGFGRTPLWYAAGNGHAGVVKILLGREEVDPDKPDGLGQTPLLKAAWSGHAGVVGVLLGREDVNPDKPDQKARIPLSYAAENGHAGVVKILLEREDVNPDRPDNDGQTPLWKAVYKSVESVVEILLEREDVNPDRPDNHDKTPLSVASSYGYNTIMTLLQSYGARTHSTVFNPRIHRFVEITAPPSLSLYSTFYEALGYHPL